MEKRMKLPSLVIWASMREDRRWMEDTLSILGRLCSLGIPRIHEDLKLNWGYADSRAVPASWPADRGEWIISSQYRREELSIPPSMKLRAYIRYPESPERAAAAIFGVLAGFLVESPVDSFPQGNRIRESENSGQNESKLGIDSGSGRAHLSERELSIAELLASGESNKTIAARLGITESTVKFHMKALFAKLGAHNRAEVVSKAMQKGLLII
jgi:DNA-binding NarL/FixJ family response regulator